VRGTGIAIGITIERTNKDRHPLMTMNDLSSDNPRTLDSKKPYEKPSFRYEKVFVTSALSCGKVGYTQSSCTGSNNKVS
jgi:hypothetical protein